MPVSKEFRDSIEDKLSAVRPIRSKAMFGGVAIYADELIFAILDDDRLWFKFDDATKADYERENCQQWAPPGSPPMGYFELPARVLADLGDLRIWVDQAIGAAERKRAKQKPRKPKRQLH